jgi:hypothetical protein
MNSDNFLLQAIRLGMAGLFGLGTFYLFGSRLNIPEFEQFTGTIVSKLKRS